MLSHLCNTCENYADILDIPQMTAAEEKAAVDRIQGACNDLQRLIARIAKERPHAHPGPTVAMYDDTRLVIKLARLLFREELSSDTKPTEKQAREAALFVLLTIHQHGFPGADDNDPTIQDIKLFLLDLAYAIYPDALPKLTKRWHTRRVDFINKTTGAKAAGAALGKHLNIATEAYLLTKAGQPGTRIVANRENMDSRAITRICTEPDIKWVLTDLYGQITSSEAAEVLERLYGGARKNTERWSRIT
jgi:hypothetical protein